MQSRHETLLFIGLTMCLAGVICMTQWRNLIALYRNALLQHLCKLAVCQKNGHYPAMKTVGVDLVITHSTPLSQQSIVTQLQHAVLVVVPISNALLHSADVEAHGSREQLETHELDEHL
jgi:hypothetical protein